MSGSMTEFNNLFKFVAMLNDTLKQIIIFSQGLPGPIPVNNVLEFIFYPVGMLVTQAEPKWFSNHPRFRSGTILITFWYTILSKVLKSNTTCC